MPYKRNVILRLKLKCCYNCDYCTEETGNMWCCFDAYKNGEHPVSSVSYCKEFKQSRRDLRIEYTFKGSNTKIDKTFYFEQCGKDSGLPNPDGSDNWWDNNE